MNKFMTGLLIGIGVGILVAPDSGEETRASLAETAEQLKEKYYKLTGKASSKLNDLRGLLDNEIEELGVDAKARILTILDEEDARNGVENFRDEFRPI